MFIPDPALAISGLLANVPCHKSRVPPPKMKSLMCMSPPHRPQSILHALHPYKYEMSDPTPSSLVTFSRILSVPWPLAYGLWAAARYVLFRQCYQSFETALPQRASKASELQVFGHETARNLQNQKESAILQKEGLG